MLEKNMVDWNNVLTAKDASLALGKNDKYIYLLWKMQSRLLLEGTVVLRGKTLLISKGGLEHLKARLEEEEKKKNDPNENINDTFQQSLAF